MAAATQISIAEYLSTTYRPDCDYVDGAVVERNMGERSHSQTQAMLAAFFLARKTSWRLWALTEQRVQVTPHRFRIPDVCVLREDAPFEQVVTVAPLICVEILSKDDSLDSIVSRLDDYLAMGVANVWVIQPSTRRGFYYSAEGLLNAKDGVLRAGAVEVPVSALFD